MHKEQKPDERDETQVREKRTEVVSDDDTRPMPTFSVREIERALKDLKDKNAGT